MYVQEPAHVYRDSTNKTNKSKILIHEREEREKERRKDRDQGNHIQTGITKKINKTNITHCLYLIHLSLLMVLTDQMVIQ
jgi:preprotein translocase subunit SecF